MSEHGEDYSNNWDTLSSVLTHRKNILSSTAEKVRIPLLKTAIEKRIDRLKTIIEIITEASIDSSQFESLLALTLDQRQMIFCKREGVIEVKYNDDSRLISHELLKFLVQPGDRVFVHDPIAEFKDIMGTKKIHSTASGVVKEVLARVGDTVPFGGVLLKLEPMNCLDPQG